VVVGLGYTYITATLHGGSAGWAWSSPRSSSHGAGLAFGTKVLGSFSRRRLFGLTITAARCRSRSSGWCRSGVVVLFVVLLGALSGIAYANRFTIVGLEVDDDTAAGFFAFFQSSIQVILSPSSPSCRSSRPA